MKSIKLAFAWRLKEVFGVDKEAPFEFDTVVAVAQKYQFISFLEFLGKLPGWIEEENQKLYSRSITQYYQYLNSPENVRKGHEFYLSTAAVGKDDNYAGADLVADWYERNLRIYRNILNIDRKPEDRSFCLDQATRKYYKI